MFVDVKTPDQIDIIIRAEHIESVTPREGGSLLVRTVSGQEIIATNYDLERFVRDLRDAMRRG